MSEKFPPVVSVPIVPQRHPYPKALVGFTVDTVTVFDGTNLPDPNTPLVDAEDWRK